MGAKEMRKTPLFLGTFIILFCSFILIGCTNQTKKATNTLSEQQSTTSNSKTVKLTLDGIKKKYTDTKIVNIQNIGEEHVLVESQQGTFANKFDIYNLKTGYMDTLPTMPEIVTLEKVVNENYFIFLASGKNSESPFGNFPHLLSCIRVKSDINKNDNFISLQDDKYFNLDYSVQSGSKEGILMANLNVTFDGLEVLFEPVKGKESYFFADTTDIPPTKTSYNVDKKQIIFEIGTNQLSDKLNNMEKVSIVNNEFMSCYEITKKDNKIYLAVTVSNLVKTYMVKTKRLPNQLPYFTVVFSGE